MHALIEPSGRVAQVAAESFEVAPPLEWVECPDGTTTAHRYEGGAFVAPEPSPPPVPTSISDRQFFQALAMGPDPYITPAEALAAVRTGEIPAALRALVDAIEGDAERFAAEMLLSGAVEFRRDHPLTEAVRVSRGMTAAEVDDLWRFAATL